MNLVGLGQTHLFSCLTDEETSCAVTALGVVSRTFDKGERVFVAGTQTTCMGVVLEGSVLCESLDVWGNRTVLGSMSRGETVAESYALLPGEPLHVDVVAREPSTIALLSVRRLMIPEVIATPWGAKLVSNLLTICARKNLQLSRRSFITAQKSIRGRVMSYLDAYARASGLYEFDIPFDRQQLADYLNVERTALSKELGRMRSDGLITFHRNHFRLEMPEGKSLRYV